MASAGKWRASTVAASRISYDPAAALVVDGRFLVRARAGHEPGVPLSAANGARRGACGAQPEHLHQHRTRALANAQTVNVRLGLSRRAKLVLADMARVLALRRTPGGAERCALKPRRKTKTRGRSTLANIRHGVLGADGALQHRLRKCGGGGAGTRRPPFTTAQVIAAEINGVQHLRPAKRRDRQAARRHRVKGKPSTPRCRRVRSRRVPVRRLTARPVSQFPDRSSVPSPSSVHPATRK